MSMIGTTREIIPWWRDDRVLKWIAQIISAIAVVAALAFLIDNVLDAARTRGLDLGFDFLDDTAGFALGESMIEYSPAMTFARAFLAGLLNTLKVALVGIVLATILGVLVALGRLSTNWLVSKLAGAYVDAVRNVPLLVQLFFWYFAVYQQLPPVRQSIQLPGQIYLSQRGLYLPWPQATPTTPLFLAFVVAGILAAVLAYSSLNRYQVRTGRVTHPFWVALALLVLLPAIGWLVAGGQPLVIDAPELQRFNFRGGMRISTEFAALLTGLVVYTAGFIAEVVRAGILAVSRGQVEAARALGLKESFTLRLVVFPQALQIIIPPLISQYLNLTKNSSLAIAIGYPDLFFVGRTIINQAGRAAPVFALVMAIYLLLSLITSLIMNIYNRQVRLVER